MNDTQSSPVTAPKARLDTRLERSSLRNEPQERRRRGSISAWGNAPGTSGHEPSLGLKARPIEACVAHPSCVTGAIGYRRGWRELAARVTAPSWGVAPGWYESGRWPGGIDAIGRKTRSILASAATVVAALLLSTKVLAQPAPAPLPTPEQEPPASATHPPEAVGVPAAATGTATESTPAPQPPVPQHAGPPPQMLAPDQQPVMYFAQPAAVPVPQGFQPHVDIHAELRNLFLHRNDTDFDRTPPIYDQNGQTVGAFATIFRPMLTFHAAENVRIYYEAELGLNYWSKNNPDEENPNANDIFVLKHRQICTEGDVLDGRVGFKVGYQLFEDPTGLFVGHWIGAANAWYAWGAKDRLGLFVGQVPDQTYEGIDVAQNNFKHDITVFGPRLDLSLGSDASLAASVVGLYDASEVDRARWVAAPAMRLSARSGDLSGFADGVVQLGKAQHGALGGADQNIFAWAAQLHGAWDGEPAAVDLNLLVLSSDDAKDGNKNNGTFLYSSRNKSATIIMTEDELRNWYDQLDRTMGAYRGGFWEHRAGLLVGDVKGTWHATEVFRPALILGAGSVLQKNAAMGSRFVGVETDLNLEFRASEQLSANLVFGSLVPGKAAAALVNHTDRSATSPIYMVEAHLLATY